MITEIQLQIEAIPGVQLRVINTLKKHGLLTIKQAVKDTPESGRLMTIEVEGDDSIGEDAIIAITNGIEGVQNTLKLSHEEPEIEEAVPELTEDEKRFMSKESEAGDVEFRDRMLVFSLLSRYPNISNRLIELKSTIPAQDRPLRLYQLGQGFGQHLVSNLKVKESISDLATALKKVVLPGLHPLAICTLQDNVISVTDYSKNLDRGKPDEQLCQFILGTIEGLLKGTAGLPPHRVEKKRCLHNNTSSCEYYITAA